MKGWMKGMLIGAAACMAAGGAMCAAAWAMGGRFYYYRGKSYGLVDLVEWEVGDESVRAEEPGDMAACEETVVISRDGTGDGWEKDAGARDLEDGAVAEVLEGPDGQVRSGETVIRKLEIEVVGGQVEIMADDSIDQVTVINYSEDYQCRQELEEDELKIYVSLYGGAWQDWLGGRDMRDFDSREGLAAKVLIPAGGSFREVELEARDGILSANQINAQKLKLEVESGVLAVSGGEAERLEGECKTGDLTYQGQVGVEMEAECAMGRIQYLIDGSREDFRYEVESAAGSIVIDGAEEGVLNRKIDNSEAKKKAKLECKAGAIDVAFQ